MGVDDSCAVLLADIHGPKREIPLLFGPMHCTGIRNKLKRSLDADDSLLKLGHFLSSRLWRPELLSKRVVVACRTGRMESSTRAQLLAIVAVFVFSKRGPG